MEKEKGEPPLHFVLCRSKKDKGSLRSITKLSASLYLLTYKTLLLMANSEKRKATYSARRSTYGALCDVRESRSQTCQLNRSLALVFQTRNFSNRS